MGVKKERGDQQAEAPREATMTTIIDISGVNNVCQNLLTHGEDDIENRRRLFPSPCVHPTAQQNTCHPPTDRLTGKLGAPFLRSNAIDLHGGERISALQTNYADRDRDSYVPDASNIAPRRKGWKPKKSNTQMPPLKGKGSDEKPQVQATRGPKYYGKLNKLL